ncbi:hypothetical protein HDR70_01995 [bacterium]|nr:hypothetical protein [bacterium]
MIDSGFYTFSVIIEVIVSITVLIISVMMIVKFFTMVNDVNEIKRILQQSLSNPTSEAGQSPDEFNGDINTIKKNDKIIINGIACIYYGKYEFYHSFYPINQNDIKSKSDMARDNQGAYYFAFTDAELEKILVSDRE